MRTDHSAGPNCDDYVVGTGVADHAVWQDEAMKRKKRKLNKKEKKKEKEKQAQKQESKQKQKQKMRVITDAISAADKQTAHPIVSQPPVKPPTSSLHKVIYIIEIQFQSLYNIHSVHTIVTN